MRLVVLYLSKIVMVMLFACSAGTIVYAAGDSTPEPAVKSEIKCPAKITYYSKAKKACVCHDKKTVWSEKVKKCVDKTAEILTDDDLYKNAVALIESEDYKNALDLLWRIKDQNQPRVLNYIGYSNRKLGKVDDGISYYYKALALNANFHQARQYLGEGYLQKSDLSGAQKQLSELANRCGKDCIYYKDLHKDIVAYKEKRI